MLVRAGQLRGRPGRQARKGARPHRRDVADAAAVARIRPGPEQPAGGPPAINPRYLSEDTDRRAVVGGIRMVRKIFAAPALQKYVGEEKLPGMAVQSDADILDYARANGNTVYHATCTCMMGPAANCVVDDQLRVHGLERNPRDRRLGDAGRDLDQHQRPDDHDRREGRGDDQGGGAAAVGGVARAGPSPGLRVDREARRVRAMRAGRRYCRCANLCANRTIRSPASDSRSSDAHNAIRRCPAALGPKPSQGRIATCSCSSSARANS